MEVFPNIYGGGQRDTEREGGTANLIFYFFSAH